MIHTNTHEWCWIFLMKPSNWIIRPTSFVLLINFSNCSRLTMRGNYVVSAMVLFYIKLPKILEDYPEYQSLLECKVLTIHFTKSSKTVYRQNCNPDIHFNLSVEESRKRRSMNRCLYPKLEILNIWNTHETAHFYETRGKFKVIKAVRVLFVWRKNHLRL